VESKDTCLKGFQNSPISTLFADAAAAPLLLRLRIEAAEKWTKALEQLDHRAERQAAFSTVRPAAKPPSSDGLKKPPAQKRTQKLEG